MVKILSFLLFMTHFFSSLAGATTIGSMSITSSSFAQAGKIPSRYTCEGKDISPPLIIDKVPAGATSLAITMEDPDAPIGIWVHWVMWNIPPATREIKENAVPAGANLGKNDWKRNAYGGPCPPSGIHRYIFKVYALDTPLHLPLTSTKRELEGAMKGHVLAKGELMGIYKKQ